LLSKQIDINNMPKDDLEIANFYCDYELGLIRGLTFNLSATPTQAEMDTYFTSAANQLRRISGLPPFELNACLSLHALGAALTSLAGHGGFKVIPKRFADCGTFNGAEGIGSVVNVYPMWQRIQVNLCGFMADGHRGPFIDPKTTNIGYGIFPDKGDLKSTGLTFRAEYG
jgi:hypothetical protein